MRSIVRSVTLLVFTCSILLSPNVKGQSVLNPADVVVNYDSTKPPTQPNWGQIGKWVRTPRPEVNWNTTMYKAYIYKGMAFRLHFPKTYAAGVSDGKKYPLMIFFHGHGEYAPIYDNEFHLLHGSQLFDNAINNGIYDGYILFPQSTSFFGTIDYANLREIIEYMITNNKLDPFQITVNGLSQGGQASWDMLYNYPTYISTSVPMSWSQTSYTDPVFINKIKYTPVWDFQGGLDGNPTPFTTNQVKTALLAAGANFKLTEYPSSGHGTWWNAWAEPDFWDVIKRGYSSNPWALGGKTSFFPGETISANLGIAAGFTAYEWRKDGVTITGATANTYTATALGKYEARVQRNGIWSDWSRTPVILKMKTVTNLPAKIEAESWGAMSSVLTEWTSDGGPGLNVAYIDYGDWMDYDVNVAAAGAFTVSFRVASQLAGAKFELRKSDGTSLATINVPNTNGWQTWQTVTANVNLPAGYQTLRIFSTTETRWNINWLQFAAGAGTNQPPTANAGTDKTITLPTSSVSLTGSGTDSDGTIASYSWSKFSGPAQGTITTPASASTTVTGLAQGTYIFRLTVTDNGGAQGSDDVMVVVNAAGNQPPTVNAGSNQTITLPTSSVSLSGSATDPDGTISTYLWSKQSGPSGATITTPSAASTTVTGLVQGTYVFRLTATDNGGATGFGDVTVTVNPSGSTGTTRIEAENWTAMSGVLTENAWGDPQGGGLIVGWIEQGDWMDYSYNAPSAGTYTVKFRVATPLTGAQLQIRNSSGTVLGTVGLPNTGGWQTWTTITTTLTLPQGVQTLRLYASNTTGWNINWWELTPGGVATNQPPTVNAGSNQTITLPTSSVSLSGSATDPDGTISTYLWSKQSGPSGATITTPSAASTTVTGLVQGTYVFRLTATDNSGATGFGDVTITVMGATSSTKIEAENWTAMSGVLTENAWGDPQGGGLIVGWIEQGDWMDYSYNAPTTGTYTVRMRVASPLTGAQLQIRNSAGTILQTVTIPNTGGWQTWTTITTTVNLTAGNQTLRLYASNTTGWNINWWELTPPGGTVGARLSRNERMPEEAITETSLSLYPNPVRNESFTMEVNTVYSGTMKVRIVNMSGAVQKEISVNKQRGLNRISLPVGNLPKGEYIVTVQMQEWQATKKLIKL